MSLAYVKCALGGFFFDATISESHDWENTITVNPVQTGANVNDHMFAQPNIYTMQIFQSDCMASIIKGQFATGATRSIAALNVLSALMQVRVPFTVQTSLCTYTDMIMKSCIINKDKTTMTALKATVVLQQVIFTDAQAVGISTLPTVPTLNSGTTLNDIINKGTISTKTVTNAISKKITSLFGSL
jgi:Na+-translocating ferredoxin:NAD+ oxidoreductase RNF subunit RnfB